MDRMARFWITIHHRDDYDPSTEDAAMHADIDALNDEMVARGVRVFVGGLHHAQMASSITILGDVQKGAHLKTDEHVGGFWVLDCENEAEAIEWGKKAAKACRAPVEVRQFH